MAEPTVTEFYSKSRKWIGLVFDKAGKPTDLLNAVCVINLAYDAASVG